MPLRAILLLLLSAAASGQTSVSTETPPLEQRRAEAPAEAQVPQKRGLDERSLASLDALQRSREAKEASLGRLRERLNSPTLTEVERSELQAQLRALQLEIEKISADFESIATGIDLTAFDLSPPESFDLQTEVLKLVEPLIEELKNATEAPRQIEKLGRQVEYLASREQVALDALKSVEALLAGLDPADPKRLRPALEASRDSWLSRIEEVRREKTVTQFQLEKRLSSRKSILESTKTALADFFRTRGWNLILALATFFVVLLLLRGIYRYLARVLSSKKKEERAFYSRLIDVLYFLFIGAFALAASLLVLYATGDWVLLGITLLFIIGVAWAFKTAIPMFLEQIRLLLNLGTVRERERLLIDGIPYRVSKLSFYTLLSNPELAGGVRRLPIKDLVEMRSRTCSKDEIWFPSRRGDWVMLSDGRQGAIRHQSPDMVQLELLGGALVTYQTGDFLGLAPQNLSAGFRRIVRFGIDYAHQAICTTQVPEIFAARIRTGIEARFGDDVLEALRVEFCEAGASSLDYQINADFVGKVAPQHEAIGRAIQKLCVETCNEQGWGIPFTQITVHQAAQG